MKLSLDEARVGLLTALDLWRDAPADMPAALERRGCVQLDPLDPLGANADLVMMARHDVGEGDFFDGVFPGHAFEHFAKERCVLPASAFPAYRDQAIETPWWRQAERAQRISAAQLDAVEAEVRERGPLPVSALSDHGRVEPIDWSGWKGTGKAATMAAEMLWLRCRLVVCGRAGRSKVVDVPERALPGVASAPSAEPFGRWALRHRVRSMGLLPTASGPWWGQLRDERRALSAALVEEGLLVEVELPGTRRRWLAEPSFGATPPPPPDDRMRLLGPLDPLLWDRDLVRLLFGFDYVWEVYKPAAQRRWGWYVVPLLHRGRLVGRFEGRRGPEGIEVLGSWPEEGFDDDAFRVALGRHGARLRLRG